MTSNGIPETLYAKSGDVSVAYQVFGAGPLDLVVIPGWISHVEMNWDSPGFARLYDRLGSFARVAVYDKRGTGLSDRNVGIAPLEKRIDDTWAVMEAVGMSSASLLGWSEGVDDQESPAVPLRRWPVGDELTRELVVEQIDAHARISPSGR